MHLSNIKLWNFRKFGSDNIVDLEKPNLDLNFTEGINVLIGENDSGKTAIVDAMKLALKTHSYDWLRLDWDDFFVGSTRLRIELKFENLIDNEAKNFTEWLGWTGEGDEAKPFLRLIYDATRNLDDQYIYPTEIRAGVDEIGYQLTAEAREYLKTTYLKPLRDAKSELIPRKNSRLTQILQGHEAFKGKDQDHLLVGLFKEFNEQVEKYFEGTDKDNVPLVGEHRKGKELKDEVDKFIKAFYSKNKESNFGVLGNNIKSILEKLELSIKDELNPGLGTLNRLFMASELLHLQKKNWNGLRLGLIEELEAHLHPQAQMQIIEALRAEENIQLILTTHSPNLASKLKLENLILCASNNAYSLGSEYTQLEPDDYGFLERFLDATKANLFFAKGVIFVEGWSEEILIPSIANKLKSQGIIQKNLTEAGVSIVNIGNTAFFRYSRIFLRKDEDTQTLDTPVSIITDVDVRDYSQIAKLDANGSIIKKADGKTDYEYIKRNNATVIAESEAKKNVIVTKWEKQNVKVYVAPNWTLEYAMYKSASLNAKFCDIFKEVHPGIDLAVAEMELGKKLINKGLYKTEIAYKLAQSIENDNAVVLNQNDEPIKYLVDAIKYACND
jgi:putative ATP-dependent endonuclease of OLD family